MVTNDEQRVFVRLVCGLALSVVLALAGAVVLDQRIERKSERNEYGCRWVNEHVLPWEDRAYADPAGCRYEDGRWVVVDQ